MLENRHAEPLHALLTRRERQIMDVLLRRRRATAAEVMNDLPGGQAYSTIRTPLRVLEEKGYVRHEDDGVRYVYSPNVNWDIRESVRAAAPRRHLLRRLHRTGGRGAAWRGGLAISDENWTASPA